MSFDVEATHQFQDWFEELDENDSEKVIAGVDQLEQDGPNLKRPIVGAIKGSRYSHMKELVVPSSSIRILFAFDPRRVAILLLGDNKEGEWKAWYTHSVPAADALYDDHLRTLEEEGLMPPD